MDCLEERLRFLAAKGFAPRTVFDIGAFTGGWTQNAKRIFPSARFHCFEANEEHRASLQEAVGPDPGAVHIGVLGDKCAEVTFFSRADTGDSVFEEQTAFFVDNPAVTRKTLPMRTLDSQQLPKPDLVKIDVQGAELLVLAGGRSCIANAEMIILETKVLEYNKGTPTFLETLTFMDEFGYVPLDITELHYLRSGELCEVDVMFVRKGSRFLKTGLLQ